MDHPNRGEGSMNRCKCTNNEKICICELHKEFALYENFLNKEKARKALLNVEDFPAPVQPPIPKEDTDG